MQRLIGAILLAILLSACSQTIEPPAPAATLQPTMAPVIAATPTLSPPTDACPAETADLKLFKNADDGYCFLYPKEDTASPPYMVVINPNGNSGGDFLPGDAVALISLEPASGRTAAQVVAEKTAEAGEDSGVAASEVVIDGKQAFVVDGLPGQDSWRGVFLVDNDRLYILSFFPWEPTADWFSELETLYGAAIASFHVLPPMP